MKYETLSLNRFQYDSNWIQWRRRCCQCCCRCCQCCRGRGCRKQPPSHLLLSAITRSNGTFIKRVRVLPSVSPQWFAEIESSQFECDLSSDQSTEQIPFFPPTVVALSLFCRPYPSNLTVVSNATISTSRSALSQRRLLNGTDIFS